jgi:hypothetical protein
VTGILLHTDVGDVRLDDFATVNVAHNTGGSCEVTRDCHVFKEHHVNAQEGMRGKTYVGPVRRLWQNSSPLYGAARRQTARLATCPPQSGSLLRRLVRPRRLGDVESHCWASCCSPVGRCATASFHPSWALINSKWRLSLLDGLGAAVVVCVWPRPRPSGACRRCRQCRVAGHQMREGTRVAVPCGEGTTELAGRAGRGTRLLLVGWKHWQGQRVRSPGRPGRDGRDGRVESG